MKCVVPRTINRYAVVAVALLMDVGLWAQTGTGVAASAENLSQVLASGVLPASIS